jgi:hypothetical protein
MFGRFQLLALLGKSERTMMWAAVDTRQQQDCMLAIPRKQPEGRRCKPGTALSARARAWSIRTWHRPWKWASTSAGPMPCTTGRPP